MMAWVSALLRFGRDNTVPSPGMVDSEVFQAYLREHDAEMRAIDEIADVVRHADASHESPDYR